MYESNILSAKNKSTIVLRCVRLKSGSGSMIQDHSDHVASNKTDESLLRVDSSVPLMQHDSSDLGYGSPQRLTP